MTVCLAALFTGDDGLTCAVVAADRMVTLGGFIEFEHAIPKMSQPSNVSVAMIAGDTLEGTRLAGEVKSDFIGKAPTTAEIASALSGAYLRHRTNRMETELLQPRALSLGAFYGQHQALNGQITMMIDNQMQNYNLGVELLLAGVDVDGAHIHSINNPGMDMVHDQIGYTAIGSGAIHALQAMIGFSHHSGAGRNETVYRAYAAKRRAEVAPGVGHDTDLAILTSEGTTFLAEDQLKLLEEAFESEESVGHSSLKTRLEALKLDVPAADDGTEKGVE